MGENNQKASMSKKTLGLFLAGIIFIIIIILATISSCSADKKIANSESLQSKNEGQTISPTNNSQIATVSTKINQNSNQSTLAEGENLLKQVTNPSFSSIKESNVLVTSKKILFIEGGNSYTYDLGLIVPNGEGYKIISYFCTKQSYDAVNIGDTVSIRYQEDASGNTSIYSIQKNN